MSKSMIYLVASLVLRLSVASTCATNDPLTRDACSDTDNANSFLQMSSNIATPSAADDQAPTVIQPFPCMKFPAPLQVLKMAESEGKGFAVKMLTVETGKYTTVFKVPFTRTFPSYQDLNSCGINPVDEIMYCTLWSKSKKHFIVRVGANLVKIVALLPNPVGKTFNSGAFGKDGTYYISDQKANFLIIRNIHKVKEVNWERNPKLSKQFAAMKLTKPRGFKSAADAVILEANLEGLGKKQYMIVLNKGKLKVAKQENGRFTKTWVFSYTKAGKPGNKREVWGAGWNFAGKVFFAHNNGEGVFEVPLDKLNLKTKALKPVNLKKIGKSQASGFNDGTNCQQAGNPWITKVFPVDCKKNGKPFHALRVPGKGYAFSKFDMATGQYEGMYFLKFSKTTPSFKYLNAMGVNPKDGIVYGCLLFDDYPATFFIVRFDGTKIEFVAKVPAKYDPVAGTFNSKGEYFIMQNNNYTHNVEMFSFSGLDTMKGFPSPRAPKLPALPNRFASETTYLKLWNLNHFADLVTVFHNFNNTGRKEYIMSINRERQAVFVDWNKANASASTVIKYKTNDPFAPVKQNHNFGAAWAYKNRVFFAANDGLGVVEASAINNVGLLTLQKVGKSAAVVNTDGFNCWNLDSPIAGSRTKAFIR